MSTLQLVVLALVQGITEFLPVSSSAHLVLAGQLAEWADQGLAFDAAVHAGTLAAVVLYFRSDLAWLARGVVPGRVDPVRARLVGGLAIATLPALVVGALLAGWIETALRDPLLIGTTTIVFGLALGAADRWSSRSREVESVRLPGALAIGLAQVLALVPGTSRSGITITAGLALGLTREAAARYSFLLSIPIIAAAGGWGFVTGLAEGGSFQFGRFLSAALVAGVFAWLTIAAFLAWLRRAGMLPFVVYRLLLGAALWILFWPGGAHP
ncbi:MAG: undecaprenyl-diphosphate phosphatase [Wenzhouxiangellaceae bacterium]|nr:undecaprenyl-diphosphate phosphatase [Wenzhouxiangellaceae bacterium]